MTVIQVALKTLNKNKKWIILGALIYLLPAIYRFLTGNSVVPILDNTLFLYNNKSQIIPVNLEVLGTLFIIPGAVGAVIVTSFVESALARRFAGWDKYFLRVFGSSLFSLAWIAVQFLGYNFFNPVGPWGYTLWTGPDAYGRNLLVALIAAPLVPYLIEFIYRRFR